MVMVRMGSEGGYEPAFSAMPSWLAQHWGSLSQQTVPSSHWKIEGSRLGPFSIVCDHR